LSQKLWNITNGVGGPTQQFCYQSLEAADWAPMTGETMAP
jgi:hypothetical protein